jgi:signal transduction histidine kinase
MSGFSIFALLSGLLQLSVPSYSLRLIRRFGTQRVGWFIVASFSCLALLHLLKPFQAMNSGPKGMLDLVYAVAALFLVIGLSHIETLCSQRQQSDSEERRLRAKWESETREQTADLAATNQRLVLEIARREQSENALKESEAQYHLLFAENPQPMWIFDLRSLRPLAVNEAALQLYGFLEREFMALTARDLASPAMAAGFLQDAAKPCSNAEFRGLWDHCRKDRTPIQVEITGVDLRYAGCPARLIVATEVSSRRQREQARSESQQRQFAGRLTGGVAHHFNNILSVISGHTSYLLEGSPDQKTVEHLDQISVAVKQATTLSRQLYMVSGQNVARPEPLALNGLIQSWDGMLCRVVGEKATLQYSLDPLLPAVFADAQVIEHVLLNLVLNAREAIADRGMITISTAKIRVQNIPPNLSDRAKPGNFVQLTVQDNGCGMTPEVQARLFEPFFTTRDVRKGAGLGLASSAGAIREHGGWIEFATEIGAGSEFNVFLPSATTWQREAPSSVATPKETILLVEPDDRVRSVTRSFLNRRGYRVIEADSASTALALWEGQGKQVALLLTETNLPDGISGRELANQLSGTRPELKVVYTPGSGAGQTGPDLIPKPYVPEQLLEIVQRLLAGEG